MHASKLVLNKKMFNNKLPYINIYIYIYIYLHVYTKIKKKFECIMHEILL